jgi:hypothetical protein
MSISIVSILFRLEEVGAVRGYLPRRMHEVETGRVPGARLSRSARRRLVDVLQALDEIIDLIAKAERSLGLRESLQDDLPHKESMTLASASAGSPRRGCLGTRAAPAVRICQTTPGKQLR